MAARTAMGIVPITALVTGTAVAQAAPQFITPQPGVNMQNPGEQGPGAVQPGVTIQPPAPAAVRTPPPATYVAPQDDAAGVAPSSDYDAPIREVPNRDYIAPLQPQTLHAPDPTPPLAEIVPAPRILRAGDLTIGAPDFLNADQIDQVNSTFARPEADISQFARSVGVAPSRADSVASGAIAGALVGGAMGAGLGVAAGTLGSLIAGMVILTPIIGAVVVPLYAIPLAGIGAAAGAAIGAGIGGLR
ncbi:hypothetical protein [Nocardia sp. NPDC020380]|uniref:hypothetical protein n=1 Tax=Nocardia sp. NPDC020380 TaxID=3364309 RepID=UPI00378AF98C